LNCNEYNDSVNISHYSLDLNPYYAVGIVTGVEKPQRNGNLQRFCAEGIVITMVRGNAARYRRDLSAPRIYRDLRFATINVRFGFLLPYISGPPLLSDKRDVTGSEKIYERQ